MAKKWMINEKGNIVFPVPETVKIPWDKSRGPCTRRSRRPLKSIL